MAIKTKVPSLKEIYRLRAFGECNTDDGVNYIPEAYSHYERGIVRGECPIAYYQFWDTFFRLHIGKTDDINIAMCSHDATINRETPEHFCRVCHKDLSVVKARVNDYLVLRHPQCTKPICLDCAKNNPDEFYKAFQRGSTTAIAVAHELYGTCNTKNKITETEIPGYPDFTGIERFTKNKVVPINKKLFGTPIYFQKKEDGMNVGCYLDGNGELELRSREQIRISEDMRVRFMKLPYAQNIKTLLKEMSNAYPGDTIMLFGEFMVKGKSPKHIEIRDEDSFKAFDLMNTNLNYEPPLVKWDQFSKICDEYKIPHVDLVEITTVHTFDELMAVRERLMNLCQENRWEGVVGKVWVTNEFGNFVNIVKEKPYIPKIRAPNNPENDLPDLPDSEITGAIEKVLCNFGEEKFTDAKFAMPQIAIKVKEQCEKHGCKKPGTRVFNLYRERVMRM